MKNKLFGTTTIATVALFLSLSCHAQPNERAKIKCKYLKKVYDVSISIPQGYTTDYEDNHFYMVGHKSRHSGAAFSYWMTATSADKACQLLYPDLNILLHVHTLDLVNQCSAYASETLSLELENCAPPTMEMPYMEWEKKYVTHYEEGKYCKATHADRVSIVDFPCTRDTAMYTHCIGIYLSKRYHVPVFLKCLLTEDAYRQKDAYIDTLLAQVRYGNKHWELDKSALKAEAQKVKDKLSAL